MSEEQGFQGGVLRPGVSTGPADRVKARMAKKATGSFGNGMMKNAGMMLDWSQSSSPSPYNSNRLDSYRTSYANGLESGPGVYDVPTYFQMMNQQNGGLLYWPVTLQEKYSWYRYWARTDAYIGRSLELLADLPMSKLTLSMPDYVPKNKQQEILDFFQEQIDILDIFPLLLSILWEVNMIGNVFIFHEWDDKMKRWSRAVVLPPEEVHIFEYPFSQNSRVEYRPERLIKIIEDTSDSSPMGNDLGIPDGRDCDRGHLNEDILAHIPEDIVKMVRKEGCIVMDTDPSTGSFVHHIARRKSPYQDLGASALERVLVPMLQKEHYRYTQLSLSSRNMTPKNLITAEGLMPAELDDLREQVDLSYMDPEYSIITNYGVTWEQIGAQDRLLDLSREYETIENQIFAALGVTRELLTGEGAFSGNKITVEILNTMFMLSREVLTSYLEKKLFRKVAEAHGWFTEDKNGVKKYWYPKVGFNRLTIRDNSEVFDSLFQLYQKGSVPVEVIYELFNLDSTRMEEGLKKDLMTVNDSTFNRMMDDLQSEVGRAIVENSDIVDRYIKYLGLKKQNPVDEGFGGGFGGGEESSGFGGGFGGDEDNSSADESSGNGGGGGDPTRQIIDDITESLPSDASENDIRQMVEERAGAVL